MKDISKLESKLGVKFKNQDLLKQALTHRSYLNENPDFRLEHNERLEFLGDAVLEIVVTEYLYNAFPNPEGELTNWRAALVKAETLSQIADELGINNFLLLSKGEAKDIGRARQYILANTLEAIIGSMYLDQGYKIVDEFIKKNPYVDVVENDYRVIIHLIDNAVTIENFEEKENLLIKNININKNGYATKEK